MAAEIEIVPQDDRGTELLDELEKRTDARPFKTNTRTGVRTYYLESAGTDGFDAMLDRIEPDWRQHLSRTPYDELTSYLADVGYLAPDAPLLPTARGTRRDKDNARARIINPVVERAQELADDRLERPLPEGITATSCATRSPRCCSPTTPTRSTP